MAQAERPLSPHLQVYRPQLTSVLSILHRVAGVALIGGAILLVWWLVGIAIGPAYYAKVKGVISSTVGQVVLFGFVAAFFYHLCNGVRHLFWDAGKLLEIGAAERAGWLVVLASAALTLVTWYFGMGG